MKTALLLIDLQRDFLSAPGLEPAAGSIVDAAAQLLAECRARRTPVVHVLTTVRRTDPGARMRHWQRADKWICEAGTPGHRTDPRLAPRDAEPVVHKTGFSPFAGGEIGPLLASLKVERLILAGVHLHGCIRTTALDAYQRGFDVWIAADAVGSDDPLHAAITRRYLSDRAIRFAGLAELEGRPERDPHAPAVDAACMAAYDAWAEWQGRSPSDRRRPFEALRAALEHERAEWVELLAAEVGKPVRYGHGEIDFAVGLVRAAIREADAPRPLPQPERARVRRRPVGLVGLVTPFNNPIAIPLGKIAPALLLGNAAVWKPSPRATGVARRLQAMLIACGVPAGLIGLVEGGAEAAVALMSDRRVAAASATGGTALGHAARDVCGRRQIPLQAELGGNNAAIVWSDADLRTAAAELAEGAFGFAGQRCTATRRVIVEGACYDAFLELFQEAAAALVVGDPHDPGTQVGPLVSHDAHQRAAGFLERAAASGCSVLAPHELPPPSMLPTIVLCDDVAAEIVQSETFAPIAVVQRAASWEDALDRLNGVRQGLAAALFTVSELRWAEFCERAEAGLLKWNVSTAGADADAPFTPWKSSATGPPEHAFCDLDFYTRLQSIYAI